METTDAKMSFWRQVGSFPANFWFANFMEILERFAFFGVRAITPLYLVASSGQNGLGLSFPQKGIIYGIWALIQCLVPMVSGGFTERYGYRKSLATAFVINILGYLGMAQSKPIADRLLENGWQNPGFWVFLVAACLIGLGTAIFKPPCWGVVAKGVTEETSSVGWGVFYWVVNIGGAAAPMCAALLRGQFEWDHVFYAAAIVTALNFLPAFLLFKEPEKSAERVDAEKGQGPIAVFLSSILTLLRDFRLVAFLLISSCFWFMLMQLWDLLPNFVDEWVNSADVAPLFAWFNDGWVLENGQTKPEMLINLNGISIILLVIPISWLIARINKVAAMVIGMSIAVVGCVGAGATNVGVICCVMILVFSIGEMTCSPTFNAYIGLIAPKEKKALYMGYCNIPFAIGWAAGNFVSGFLYENMANKIKFARQYMVDRLGMDPALVLDEQQLPKEEVMQTLAAALNDGAGATVQEANQLLWDLHDPYMVWVYLGAFGVAGTIGMIIFYFATVNRTSQEGCTDKDGG